MNSIAMFYIPCSSVAEAKKIAHRLLSEKVIACANILGETLSLYEWEGKLTESKEAVLVLKTTFDKKIKVNELVVEEHSYECPAIIEFAEASANKQFYDWVVSQTAKVD